MSRQENLACGSYSDEVVEIVVESERKGRDQQGYVTCIGVERQRGRGIRGAWRLLRVTRDLLAGIPMEEEA